MREMVLPFLKNLKKKVRFFFCQVHQTPAVISCVAHGCALFPAQNAIQV